MKNFQLQFQKFVDRIGYIMLAIFVFSVFVGSFWCLFLEFVPPVFAWFYKQWVNEKERNIEIEVASHAQWHVFWTDWPGYENVARLIIKNWRGSVERIREVSRLPGTFTREMSFWYEILDVTPVKIPRSELESMLTNNNEIDSERLGEYLDKYYGVEGKPSILDEPEQGQVEWIPEHFWENKPTGNTIYKKLDVKTNTWQTVFIGKEGWAGASDPLIVSEPEIAITETDKDTGRWYKKVNGKFVDVIQIENANDDPTAPQVYRVRSGRYKEMRVKSPTPETGDDKYEIRTWFVIFPGSKEAMIQYKERKVPRHGFLTNVPLTEWIGLRMECITLRKIFIYSCIDCEGIRRAKRKPVIDEADIRDKIIQVLGSENSKMKIALVAKEQFFADQERQMQTKFGQNNFNRGMSVLDKDIIGNHEKTNAPSPLPKTPIERNWLLLGLLIGIIIGAVLGLCIGFLTFG